MKKEQVIKLFLELTSETFVYGFEKNVIEILSNYNLQKDHYGNYFIKIGDDSRTLFTSHLDVYGDKKKKVNHQFYENNHHTFIKTDGTTVLGADDKAGVIIMLNMIENGINGTYYFMMGEDSGTIGSTLIYKNNKQFLSNFDRCISFDRMGYGSIINRQKGRYCCSDEFVNALRSELSKSNMEFKADPYGTWTDSALFMGFIPECTNLSVGYFKQHTVEEHQDIDYLTWVCEAVLKVNWDNLPTVRKPINFDSVDPNIPQPEKSEPIYKLYKIANEIDDLVYDLNRMYVNNMSVFEPEKELNFFDITDLNNERDFSMIIHWDGALTFKKKDFSMKINSYDEFKGYTKSKIKKMLKFKNVN